MIIPALKDADGDYWIAVGGRAERLTCLSRHGYVDGAVGVDPNRLSDLGYGPFTKTHLAIVETAGCGQCLTDRHYCPRCRDAVEHNHSHEEV